VFAKNAVKLFLIENIIRNRTKQTMCFCLCFSGY